MFVSNSIHLEVANVFHFDIEFEKVEDAFDRFQNWSANAFIEQYSDSDAHAVGAGVK